MPCDAPSFLKRRVSNIKYDISIDHRITAAPGDADAWQIRDHRRATRTSATSSTRPASSSASVVDARASSRSSTDDRVPDDIRDAGQEDGTVRLRDPPGVGWSRPEPRPGRRDGDGVRLHHAGAAVDVRHQQRHRRARCSSASAPTSRRRAGSSGIASGEVVASFALTEPGAGSNPSGLRTKAVRDGDELGDHRPQAVHHQRPDRRPVHRLRPHPARRRRRPRHRGVPGARRRRGRRGRRQGRQDGPGGRLDLRRQLRRGAGRRRRADRRQPRTSATGPR